MSYYRVRVSKVRVIGQIWQPGFTCAQTYTLSANDEHNIGEPTRENVEDWLSTHAGDFSHIQDFEADIGDAVLIPWADPDSECVYNDCMCPNEEE